MPLASSVCVDETLPARRGDRQTQPTTAARESDGGRAGSGRQVTQATHSGRKMSRGQVCPMSRCRGGGSATFSAHQ